jgi:diacylglycerol kinase family enzyme
MQKRPIPLFINPAAGRGRARRRAKTIRRLLVDSGVEFEEIQSTGVGDLEYKVFAAASALFLLVPATISPRPVRYL